MAWTQEKIEATLKNIVEKAQVDPLFRDKLKNNPREVLVAEANEAIPESFCIGVIDQNDVDLVITLPKIQSDELSDADLEQVAGGKTSPDRQEYCNRTIVDMITKSSDKIIGPITSIPIAPVIYIASKLTDG